MEPTIPGPIPTPNAEPRHSLFEVARADEGVVVWESVAGWLRVVALGPAPTGKGPGLRFLDRAKGAIREQLHAAVPEDDPFAECARLMRAVDQMIRERVPPESEERATMVVAVAHQGLAWVGHTGDGAACLLRDGELTWLLDSLPESRETRALRDRREARHLLRSNTSPPVVPWIGVRPNTDREPLLVRVRPREVRLQPGDRLLLSSVPARDLRSFGPLKTLLAEPQPDDAAQGLGSALAVQRTTAHQAVALLAWGPSAQPADDVQANLEEEFGGELVQGLTDLIREITDEFDLGATPPYEQRTAHPDDEAGYAVPVGSDSDPSAEPAEHSYVVRGRDEVLEEMFLPHEAVGAPSVPTIEPKLVAQALANAAPPSPPPRRSLGLWLGLFAIGFGLTLLAFILAFALAAS